MDWNPFEVDGRLGNQEIHGIVWNRMSHNVLNSAPHNF
jgi:hypothetical protein